MVNFINPSINIKAKISYYNISCNNKKSIKQIQTPWSILLLQFVLKLLAEPS